MNDILQKIEKTIFPIITWPNPLLSKQCEDIDPLTLENTHGMNINQLLFDMINTCVAHGGVGLAAPQIGLCINVIVIVIDDKVITLINPKVIYESAKTNIFNEGCLSMPGYYVDIERSSNIAIEHMDVDGKIIHTKYTGIYARIIAHELDHLEGKTLGDNLKGLDIARVETLIESNI